MNIKIKSQNIKITRELPNRIYQEYPNIPQKVFAYIGHLTNLSTAFGKDPLGLYEDLVRQAHFFRKTFSQEEKDASRNIDNIPDTAEARKQVLEFITLIKAYAIQEANSIHDYYRKLSPANYLGLPLPSKHKPNQLTQKDIKEAVRIFNLRARSSIANQ
jgi:hypothetical protein